MEEHSQKRRRISPRNSATVAPSASTETTKVAASGGSSFTLPSRPSLAHHKTQDPQWRRPTSPPKPIDARESSHRISNSSNDLNAKPASAAAGGPSDPSSQSIGRIGSGVAVSPARTSAKPEPRPLPPPAPEGDDELSSIRLMLGRNARRSPILGISTTHPEPDLPPSVPDVVSSTLPRGIHSSPSEWRDRNRPKRSSPLKSKMGRLGDSLGKSVVEMRGSSNYSGSSKDDASAVVLDARTDPARQIPAYDADAEKKKERDSLREEIAKLKRDLEIVNRENEHIRLMQSSGRIISSQDEDAVLDVMQRHLIELEDPPPPPASRQLVKAALNPIGLGLVPFCRPTPLIVAEEEEDVSDIKSHHPVPMTAEEELPYLQLFSPFAVESTITVLPQLPDQPVRQRHLMTFRSKDAMRLFTAKVEMIVNAENLSILELNVLALEPAAKAELTPFLDKICSDDCNRSMQRNVGMLSWAMGEWYRAAIQRARLWSQLEGEVTAKGRLLRATGEMRKRKKRPRDDEAEDGPVVVSSKPSSLLQFMGQQFFDITIPAREPSDPAASLRLEWKIDFDWVGEARSKLAVLIEMPGKWRSADSRGTLGKLPKLFEELVEGGEEPFVAVTTIAALLAGEGVAADA